jgi:hypothetical protein
MLSARYWREIPQRYRLEAKRCKKCEEIHFPPRLICPSCQGRTFERVKLPLKGKLLTYTIIRVPPQEFVDEAPYAIGIVELEKGVKITAQITDLPHDEIRIGMELNIEFRKIREDKTDGIICYGYKCVPPNF